MPGPRDPAIVERARILVTTTTRPLADIAREVKVTVRTLRDWIDKHGWQRPPGAGRKLKLTPAKEGPVQRAYEIGVSTTDLAILLECDPSYVSHVARHRQWTVRAAASAPPPASEEIAALMAALRAPETSRREAIRLMERAIALTAADALASGDARAGRSVDMLGKLVAHLDNLPDDAAPSRRKDSDAAPTADHFPDANDLIEEIARRIEADANEWLDPRILAAVAAAVP